MPLNPLHIPSLSPRVRVIVWFVLVTVPTGRVWFRVRRSTAYDSKAAAAAEMERLRVAYPDWTFRVGDSQEDATAQGLPASVENLLR